MNEMNVVTASGTPEFVATNPNRTAIVFNFNTGAHMRFFEEYKQGFGMLLSWLDSWDVDHSKLLAFYRDTLPAHAGCSPSKESFEDEGSGPGIDKFEILRADPTRPFANYSDFKKSTQAKMQLQMQMKNKTLWEWYDFKHSNGTTELYNSYSKGVFDSRPANKLQIHWLNVYNSTILRRDGHCGFGDCLHYLHPGPTDWWVHFFYSALLDLAELKEIVHW